MPPPPPRPLDLADLLTSKDPLAKALGLTRVDDDSRDDHPTEETIDVLDEMFTVDGTRFAKFDSTGDFDFLLAISSYYRTKIHWYEADDFPRGMLNCPGLGSGCPFCKSDKAPSDFVGVVGLDLVSRLPVIIGKSYSLNRQSPNIASLTIVLHRYLKERDEDTLYTRITCMGGEQFRASQHAYPDDVRHPESLVKVFVSWVRANRDALRAKQIRDIPPEDLLEVPSIARMLRMRKKK